MFFHPPGLPGLHEELRGHHVETGPERHDKHDIFCGEWLELGVCIHIIHVHRNVNVYTEDIILKLYYGNKNGKVYVCMSKYSTMACISAICFLKVFISFW